MVTFSLAIRRERKAIVTHLMGEKESSLLKILMTLFKITEQFFKVRNFLVIIG